ncbi:hypothetical protein MC7420_2309 [Coleofasciculus chthonoplastes PCC 7420]|uniref:Uncharacterized protein n=1 Tax=Coleofasciculus chthonoplastes PCC 7420 TaxID=118168 RepID=B4VSA2_9CYAN|nr:hypothetical protein [Coleofasciculus chthonoplastes]EDX75305.1 hypothetical protein MC7420_2309 [Coleofasciculus chthonoplastes PCC 7420]
MNDNQNFLHDINQQLFSQNFTDKHLRERIFFRCGFSVASLSRLIGK